MGRGARLNALDLFEMLGEPPREFPFKKSVTIQDDAETVAGAVRNVVGPKIESQVNLTKKQRDKFPAVIRHAFERAGILTLKHGRVRDFRARGFCIAEFPLPVIVFGNEAPGGQAFTFGHELAHVVLKQSAISGYAPVPRAP